MRIAYLCPDVETPRDGPLSAAVRVGGLARSLARIGHDVQVFTPQGGAELLGSDVPVVELRVQPFEEGRAADLEADPNLGPEAASEARSIYASVLRRRADAPMAAFSPDLVIERSSLFGGAGLTMARKAGIPIVVDVVAPVVDPGATGRTRLRPAWIRNADHLIAATPGLATWLSSVVRDPSQVQLLTGGIEIDHYDRGVALRLVTRAKLGISERAVIGYVGELDSRHDLEPLILAMGFVDQKGIDPHLLIVGEGPQRTELERVLLATGLGEAVSFIDQPPPSELPAYVAAFDAAVTASTEVSLELLAYLAAARPVAAPDCEDHHCLQAARTAWFYPPADPGELAVTVGMILRNQRWGAEIGAAGREHVREHHSWEQAARALAALAAPASSPRASTEAAAPVESAPLVPNP